MAPPRPLRLAAALVAGALSLASCGGEGQRGDGEKAIIVLTLRVPGASKDETDSLGKKLLQAFDRERVGDIVAVEKGASVLEVTIRIRELSAINKIKKSIIRIEPATEYRIEHR